MCSFKLLISQFSTLYFGIGLEKRERQREYNTSNLIDTLTDEFNAMLIFSPFFEILYSKPIRYKFVF